MTNKKFKTFASTKALLQAILDRRNTDISNEDIRLADKLLHVMLENKPLYIIADASRFAYDFAHTLKLEYKHIQKEADVDQIQAGSNVVIMYMGPRTAKQKEFYLKIFAKISVIEGVEIWRISRW